MTAENQIVNPFMPLNDVGTPPPQQQVIFNIIVHLFMPLNDVVTFASAAALASTLPLAPSSTPTANLTLSSCSTCEHGFRPSTVTSKV